VYYYALLQPVGASLENIMLTIRQQDLT